MGGAVVTGGRPVAWLPAGAAVLAGLSWVMEAKMPLMTAAAIAVMAGIKYLVSRQCPIGVLGIVFLSSYFRSECGDD